MCSSDLKEKAVEAIERMGLSPTVRGETLTLEQFVELTNFLFLEEA